MGPLRGSVPKGVLKLLKKFDLYSELDHPIPPEIIDDEFYRTITSLARTAPIKSVLEIGSSTGEGSTRAFVEGIHQNPDHPILFCMEVSQPRFEQVKRRYQDDPQVRCYNMTSVPLQRFASEAEVIDFCRTKDSNLQKMSLSEVLRWRRQDIRYITRQRLDSNGIQMIKAENGITNFGMVLIDGSEFTGHAELDEVYGADYILLDDIRTFKNFTNYERLSGGSEYRVVAENKTLRNGFAAFERIGGPSVHGQG